MKHMIRSRKKILAAEKVIANDVEKAGISIKSTLDLMTVQSGGHEHSGFLDIDYRN